MIPPPNLAARWFDPTVPPGQALILTNKIGLVSPQGKHPVVYLIRLQDPDLPLIVSFNTLSTGFTTNFPYGLPVEAP